MSIDHTEIRVKGKVVGVDSGPIDRWTAILTGKWARVAAVQKTTSLYVPDVVNYTLSYLWEKYSSWSEAQLPPSFNRRKWHAYWKKTRYSNEKLKSRVGLEAKDSDRRGVETFFRKLSKRASRCLR